MMTQEEQLNQIRISLLQLQRSALLDTQTIMQLLLDKNICTLDELLETRTRIEENSTDIHRIDEQITQLGSKPTEIPNPDPEVLKSSVSTQLQQLKDLLEKMKENL